MHYTIERTTTLDPQEIINYQKECGSNTWGVGTVAIWQDAIERALCIVTIRVEGKLVGLGFLVGNLRHADPVDVSVHPSFQNQGLGKLIIEELLSFAEEQQIKYITLVRDPQSPWLKTFYEQFGFQDINFAMTYLPSATSEDY